MSIYTIINNLRVYNNFVTYETYEYNINISHPFKIAAKILQYFKNVYKINM